jgi:hypothetical protein
VDSREEEVHQHYQQNCNPLISIGRALDENEDLLMASIDLSSVFDIVNTSLMKRLKIIGFSLDILSLIYDLLLGTVQGSILGPFLVQYSHSLCLMLENCGHLPMIRSF